MKKYIFISSLTMLTLIIALFFAACTDNKEDTNAAIITISQIQNAPGFEWYTPEFASYQPNQQIIAQIQTAFNPNIDKFVIYTRPGCSCDQNTRKFPRIMKILSEANVPDSCCVIYSMSKTYYNHPYMKMITINSIPETYVLKNSAFIYSVIDTLEYIAAVDPNNTTTTLEQLVLAGLKK